MQKRAKKPKKKKAISSRAIFLRVSAKLWAKIEAEMVRKELEKPQPIILAALRTRYKEETLQPLDW